MAFIRLNENLTVNAQYIVKVKWKVTDDDELAASVFVSGGDKNEVVAIKGELAYKLWDMLHLNEEYPKSPLQEAKEAMAPAPGRRARRDW